AAAPADSPSGRLRAKKGMGQGMGQGMDRGMSRNTSHDEDGPMRAEDRRLDQVAGEHHGQEVRMARSPAASDPGW
ncbi:hypothetical protein, partial [Methylobacterium soli]|uniref:hypothetical protein n=1 Tax=Methylobacterium soli TaxID=553447 RepID=UPI001EE36EC8